MSVSLSGAGNTYLYLFEHGEYSPVMTQLPANAGEQAEQYIAAEVKKNYRPLFITQDQQHVKYYTAERRGRLI